jgi:hypothetical protein
MVRLCLSQWCAATHGSISYKFATSADSANLILDYTDRKELVSSDHELGIDGNTDMRIRAQDNTPDWANIVILVKDGPGAIPFRNKEFLTRSCLHELGHALGMHGHSPSSRDVMFSAATVNGAAMLSERDKKTIQRIYQR